MHQDPLPTRVRLLVLGGGIHGVGVLHDLATRGWHDIHLIEKNHLGSGTSSRSTKLIHGGLRYLRHARDFWLVSESLKERQVLMHVAGDLVKPLELLLPAMRGKGMPPWMLRAGLFLYDSLAAKARIKPHQKLSFAAAKEKIPHLRCDEMKQVFSFWDSQTDDLRLVRRIAASARSLGAKITEGCRAIGIRQTEDGWLVDLETADGKKHQISTLYILNALGPWANTLLEQSSIRPVYRGINNEGVHLLFDNIGLQAGLLAQSPEDGRIFFILPWNNMTLVGTTESIYAGDPDRLIIKEEQVNYLLERVNRYLDIGWSQKDIRAAFSGLRWLALDEKRDLSSTSRGYEIGEHASARGLLLTIYGGKLTTYRKLSESIGDRITSHFGEFRPSRTTEETMWVRPAHAEHIGIERFLPGGLAFNARG